MPKNTRTWPLSSHGIIRWSYETEGPVYSSAAFAGGRVYIASTDGFLYSFDLTGEPPGIPQSTITNQLDEAVLANPNGSITVRGTLSGTAPKRIEAAIQNTLTGKWWNKAQNNWGNYIVNSFAITASP